MLEANTYRKNKINLSDYDYQTDIKNRLLMSKFSKNDLEVLEEILYSSLRLPIQKLADSLDLSEKELFPILTKLSETELFQIEDDTIVVNKEMRKYLEIQLMKFEENFTPGMEFLQSILKKVPIHVLPIWYPIPRTSNNIFDSLVEKYLITPQVFQRYLSELQFPDERMHDVFQDVMSSDELEIPSHKLKTKYAFSDDEFAEIMLHLEFNFICCLTYHKAGNGFTEVVSPFHEWKEYLKFLRSTQSSVIQITSKIQRQRPDDFSFTKDLSTLLNFIKKSPMQLRLTLDEKWIPEDDFSSIFQDKFDPYEEHEKQMNFEHYLSKLIHKLLFLRLAQINDSELVPAENCDDWLILPIEKRALSIYRHTLKNYPFSEFSHQICTERHLHEIEKSITRIIGKGWVLYQDFIKGIMIPLSEDSRILLKKTGRFWKYSLPLYSDEESHLINLLILEWLFEGAIIAKGWHQGKQAINVTPLGESLFG